MSKIEKLSKKIKKFGFIYNQVSRSDNAAVYEQVNDKDEPVGKVVGFETFQITISKPFSLTAKKTKSFKEGDVLKVYNYPASEKYPGNESFGLTSWSYTTKVSAMKKFEEIK